MAAKESSSLAVLSSATAGGAAASSVLTAALRDSTGGSSSNSPHVSKKVHYLQVDTDHRSSGVQGEEGQGAAAEDSQGTKESEDEKGTDLRRSRSSSGTNKDKKGFFSPRGGILNIFSASHRNKNAELHKIFTSLPATEKLIDDYSCALQRDILIHGRLYVTQSWLCFYANIFSWETLLTIPFQSVEAITKEKTALVIPNAIQISTSADKYGFSSLVNRDITYNVIFKCWQNSLLDHAMSPLELVKAARKAHGESTDVGTEEDLWGLLKDHDGELQDDNATPRVNMSMPTHLEIGLLPQATIPHNTDTKPFSSVPASVNHREAKPEAEPVNSDTTKDASQSPAAAAAVGALSMDHPERVSIGGDSVASSEYETVSLFEETGEVPCGCSEHVGRTIINDVYTCDVETMFKLIFTDSDFMRNFYKSENATNLEIGEWHTQPDSTRLRDLSYTLALNYSFGPKFSHTTDHQIYSKMGQPGLKHIVDTEVVNHNIPYSDTFFVACRYCITRVTHNQTRLRITANIKFKKTCWGLVKNLIERNAGDGIRNYYTHLDQVLKEHIESLPAKRKKAHRRASRHALRLKSKRRPSQSQPAVAPVQSPVGGDGSTAMTGGLSRGSVSSTRTIRSFDMNTPVDNVFESAERKGKSTSFPRVNLALTLLLGILILSNMVLYHHLMSYRSPIPTHTDTNQQQYSRGVDKSSPPPSHDEWISLVQEQLKSRDQELHHWQDTLYSFVQALDQIEATVKVAKEKLLSQIEVYQNAERQRSSSQTEDKKSSQRSDVDNEADPVISVKEDEGLPVTNEPLPKQEL